MFEALLKPAICHAAFIHLLTLSHKNIFSTSDWKNEAVTYVESIVKILGRSCFLPGNAPEEYDASG